MKEKIRVVSATVHQKNNEVEVIVEKNNQCRQSGA